MKECKKTTVHLLCIFLSMLGSLLVFFHFMPCFCAFFRSISTWNEVLQKYFFPIETIDKVWLAFCMRYSEIFYHFTALRKCVRQGRYKRVYAWRLVGWWSVRINLTTALQNRKGKRKQKLMPKKKSYKLMANNNIYCIVDKQGEKSKDYQKKNRSKNNSGNSFLGETDFRNLACVIQWLARKNSRV